MAFILRDRVRENFTTVGTGAVTLAGAAAGFRTFASVMSVADTCWYCIVHPNTAWEIGLGTYSGVNTFTRTTVIDSSAGLGTAVSFAAGTKDIFIGLPSSKTLSVDSANTFTAAQRTQARRNLNAVLKGQLFGLVLSAAGASSSFGITVGEAADSTGVDLMELLSAYTKTTAAWSVGTAAGGLDTGTIAVSTWYHVYEIKRPDTGVVDVCISTNAATPNLTTGNIPTAYTLFRRIGSMKTDASSQWIKFLQTGDDFYWDVPIADASNVSPVSGASYTLSTPLGLSLKALITYSFSSATLASQLVIHNPLVTAQAPNTPGGYFLAYVNVINTYITGQYQCFTNLSSQLRAVCTAASNFYIITHGWNDNRGKYA